MISEYFKRYITGICVAIIVALIALYVSKAEADVRCKKFPSTEPGPIVIFTGSVCPVGWQQA